jgi:two-component system, NarL family, nitrate/nitrite response regulator NarL
MGQQIKILLVDDHGLFRESLSRLLQAETDFRIAGTCGSTAEALTIIGREHIDVVLLDYDLGEEQGSSFLESAKKQNLSCRVLMVTAGMTDAGTLRALEGGAAGIFLKHSPPAQLVEAIYKVMKGEMWLDSRAVRSLVAGASGKSDEQRTSQPLSERERAVLKGVFEGFTNKEIATRLQTSEGTVKAVMQQLFDKTGVRTRSQLVRIALERLTEDWRPGEA